MGRSFDELVDEAVTVSAEGWDFSWLDGRATEQRPLSLLLDTLPDRA